ncbi:putative lipid II flippase FtsW [Lysobacteraceae bacterium NML95-0200]|nr:putative lipid II flippase FtsW [Xanthomonadaceae bacterium NML95-0200]
MDGRYTPRIQLERQAVRLDAVSGRFDEWLLLCVLALTSVGLVMVASSSIAMAEARGLGPMYYFYRHILSVLMGMGVMLVLMYRCDIRQLEKYSRVLLALGVLLLLLVWVPGLGHSAKGARRWLNLGIINFQPAEAVKLIFVIWLASYLSRFSDEVKGSWRSMLKVFIAAALLSIILVEVQKDFGTTALLLATAALMLVIGGVHLPRMIMPVALLMPALIWFVAREAYRMRRIRLWINPWEDPFGDGYQLTNALMAVGRGELWGVGLGGSVQKLNYLPEAYTDFIMAVLAEEFGFIGVCALIALYALLVGRILWLGLQCVQMRRYFPGYLCFGIGMWMALQTFISIGVNIGLLPTKGLTLPLVSFGGSSILVTFAAMGLLLRVSWELERARRQVALHREMSQQGRAVVAAEAAAAPAPAASMPRSKPVNEQRLPGKALWQRLGGWLYQPGVRHEARRQRIEPSFGNGGQP